MNSALRKLSKAVDKKSIMKILPNFKNSDKKSKDSKSIAKMNLLENARRKNSEKKIQSLIENEEDKEISNDMAKNSIIKDFTLSVVLKIGGAVFQSVISILACITYVVNTYVEQNNKYKSYFTSLEVLFALVFLIDYLWGFFHAKNKVFFIRKYLFILLIKKNNYKINL